MRYVYADILFFVDFCFDFSLLYLAGRFAHAPVAGRRLALAALLGGLHGTVSLFPGFGPMATPPIQILVSALMVAVAYPTGVKAFRRYLTVLGLFYLCSFVMGGAAIGWAYITTGTTTGLGVTPGTLGPGVVLPAVVFGATLLHWAIVSGRERESVEALLVSCRVVVGDRQAEFPALVDTGNRLRDPLSDAPVVIVEYPALGLLLPPQFGPVWEASVDDEPDLGKLADALGDSGWSSRLRLVPFSSIGKASGLLVGFRPDELRIGRRGGLVRTADVIVCVSPRPLSAAGGYRALLPPEVLRGEAVA